MHEITKMQKSGLSLDNGEKITVVNMMGIELIKSSADFANKLQFVDESHRATYYDVMKNRLLDFIQSSSDLANILQYLSEEQRLDFFDKIKDRLINLIHSDNDRIFALRHLPPEIAHTLTPLLNFVGQMNASDMAKQFASAFLEGNDNKIKALFESLLKNNHPNHQDLSFFKQQRQIPQLVDALSHLGPHWLTTLNDALDLNLSEKCLSSKKDIINALESYLPPSPSSQARG